MTIEQVDRIIDEMWPRLEGWCTVAKAQRIARLAAGCTTDRPAAVELGVFGGRSLIAIGLGFKHCLNKGRIDGVDPYTAEACLEGTNSTENDHWWSTVDLQKIKEGVVKALRDLALTDFVHLLVERSQDIAHNYEKESLDILHQDSNHSEEVSCFEVTLWTPKLRPGGYWIFDDTNWESTRKAQARLEGRGFKRIEQWDSWAIFQKP